MPPKLRALVRKVRPAIWVAGIFFFVAFLPGRIEQLPPAFARWEHLMPDAATRWFLFAWALGAYIVWKDLWPAILALQRKEGFNYLIFSTAAVMAAILIYGVVRPVIKYFGPYEGQSADSVVALDLPVSLGKNQHYPEVPFGVNLRFSTKKDADMCVSSTALASPVPAPVNSIDLEFSRLLWDVDFAKGDCPHFERNQGHYTTAFSKPPEFLFNKQIEKVAQGDGNIYALYLWEYKLEGDPNFYVTEYCAAYDGSFDNTHDCPGDHNRTYIHMVN